MSMFLATTAVTVTAQTRYNALCITKAFNGTVFLWRPYMIPEKSVIQTII